MRLTTLIVAIMLAGCSTVTPVERKFPDVPAELMVKCPDLSKVPPDATKLSELLDTVAINYSHYHQCRSTVELWQQWYTEQQKTFK